MMNENKLVNHYVHVLLHVKDLNLYESAGKMIYSLPGTATRMSVVVKRLDNIMSIHLFTLLLVQEQIPKFKLPRIFIQSWV